MHSFGELKIIHEFISPGNDEKYIVAVKTILVVILSYGQYDCTVIMLLKCTND